MLVRIKTDVNPSTGTIAVSTELSLADVATFGRRIEIVVVPTIGTPVIETSVCGRNRSR